MKYLLAVLFCLLPQVVHDQKAVECRHLGLARTEMDRQLQENVL